MEALQTTFDESGSLGGALRLVARRVRHDAPLLRDANGGALDAKNALIGAAVLARVLPRFAVPRAGVVGVMLPNVVGVLPVILALQEMGAVPAMLNYTAGLSNLTSALHTGQISVFLTSRAFVQKAKLEELIAGLEPHARIVYLEDVRAGVSLFDKLRGAFFPARFAARGDDTAVVLFTSGSEGVPKGVALSHRNLLANMAQTCARVQFYKNDVMFSALPLFHSFGLMAGLLLPLLAGFRTYLSLSPLQYKTICEEVRREKPSIFLSTDTFLRGLAMQSEKGDFASLRYLVAGAEPVREPTRALWRDMHGIEIFEGYGVTETSPVVSVNLLEDNRQGTVGRLFPRMEARLESVEGIAEGGRLFLRGPNVMKGYIFPSNPGVIQPLADGWHDTGDIVTLDADQFIAIKGRVKRFAKMGGEMVSLAAVEAMLSDLYPELVCAVVAVPDTRKGERLVLLTPAAGLSRTDIHQAMKGAGATELMVPAEVVVGEVPLLGSGKVNHPMAREMVIERLSLKG